MSDTPASQEKKRIITNKGIIMSLMHLLEQKNFISTSERMKLTELLREGKQTCVR